MKEMTLQPLPDNPVANDHSVLTQAINQDRQAINLMLRADRENTAIVNNHAAAFDHIQQHLTRASHIEIAGVCVLTGLLVFCLVMLHCFEKRLKKLEAAK